MTLVTANTLDCTTLYSSKYHGFDNSFRKIRLNFVKNHCIKNIQYLKKRKTDKIELVSLYVLT